MTMQSMVGVSNQFKGKDYIYVPAKDITGFLASNGRKVNQYIFFIENNILNNVYVVSEGDKKYAVTDSLALAKGLEAEAGGLHIRCYCQHPNKITCDYISYAV